MALRAENFCKEPASMLKYLRQAPMRTSEHVYRL